jgi:BASS family bile acid:Na+ symporter
MKLLLPAAIFILMVSIGMSLRLPELIANWRRLTWGEWLRLLLATFILPAAVALVLARVLFLSLPNTGALFMLGATPGAPLLTRNLARRGFDMHLAASYQVWSGAMTPLMIPVMLFAAAKLYDRTIWIPPRILLLQIIEKQFLPLAVGMLLMHLAPRFSQKAQRGMNMVGNLVLTLVFILLLWKMGPQLKTTTPRIVLATFLLLVVSILVMHLLVRGDAIVVRTLAVSNANRHVGLVLLLMGRFQRAQDVVPVIACYAILVAILLVLSPRIFRPRELATQKATA